MTTKGHQVGKLVSEKDRAPEFSAQTLPPGSAPADRTFVPNTRSEVPGQADNEQTLRQHGKESTYTPASATLGGATSGDVNTGYGHPGQGQSSAELRHDGQSGRTRQGGGLESIGVDSGAGVVSGRDREDQRALDRDFTAGTKGTMEAERGNKTLDGAENMLPEGAQTLASERD
ncbi:MAG: hypothetical protein Q9227_003958 [Pyrenula ochraceoflavens]